MPHGRRKSRGIRGKHRARFKAPAVVNKAAIRAKERPPPPAQEFDKYIAPAWWLPEDPPERKSAKESARVFVLEAIAARKREEWPLGDARQLVRDGYTVKHVAWFTGWPTKMLEDVRSDWL